ncbi:F-box/LRR-repeat protein 4-like [Mya arenaria]|uniref:F-box/LRR-repeat protein 4-like n=1 Tax=Mya arenaria TaxID=6604 RepID=UPI0022E89082|nr:F-box/LRR-repeat protein 4-like [Mya arenaria]XP_052776976.1 F-box/LRR-repeat protein 4-like [Mya arenaria]
MLSRVKKMLAFKSHNSPPKDTDPIDEYCKKGKKSDIVIFNALEVSDFSSQYGSETSISYTASNLAGRGNVYPNYGDFTQACVFRTYGDWWDRAPSGRQRFARTPEWFTSQDYIELVFQRKVYPIKLEIYETYNPGCVVRILACDKSMGSCVDTGNQSVHWKTLWSGKASRAPAKSRVFCPPLAKCPFPTDLIRLELCHKHVIYYTELDYVLLYGSKVPGNEEDLIDDEIIHRECTFSDDEGEHETDVTMATSKLGQLTLGSGSPVKQEAVSTDTEETSKQEENREETVQAECCNDIQETQGCTDDPETDNGYFGLLPEEVIQLILSFLDVMSLCRVARTCSLLRDHSYDPFQYKELNLQPYWNQVNDIALKGMLGRSRFLQRLNLSWCHGNILTEQAFCWYIEECGESLQSLYLSSCSFVTDNCLDAIVRHCKNLSELELDSCSRVSHEGLQKLASLSKLQRLNLYRTMIDQKALSTIIISCPELRHLNIGATHGIHNCDEILQVLGKHSRHLLSLDLWRCKTVTDIGLRELAVGCTELQELDIGWCFNIKSSSGSIRFLVENCKKIKKLFLTANRTVDDEDLLAIANNCPDLEQLDILGTRQVSADIATRLLQQCEKLEFFDVSFCTGIDKIRLHDWSTRFPRVDVKKSFQN